MAEKFQPQTFNINNINGGKRYQNGDGVTAESINAAIEASAFAQSIATNQPDISNIDGDGVPSVSVTQNSNGEPILKFENLAGKDGKTPYIGANGNWWIGDTDTGALVTIPREEYDWYNSFIANGTVGLAYESDGTAWTCTGMGTATATDIVLSSHICGLPVKGIGASAFRGNTKIITATLSKNISTVGDYAFYGASNLNSIEVSAENNYLKSLNGNLYTKDMNTIIQYSAGKIQKTYEVEYGTKILRNGAFCKAASLTNINLPSTLTNINDYAFYQCTGLIQLNIPINVISVSYSMCRGCSNLASITFEGDISIINDYAFYECAKLKRIDLSLSRNVPQLKAATVFTGCHADLQIKVPESLYEQWKVATNWSTYADKIVTEFTNEV